MSLLLVFIATAWSAHRTGLIEVRDGAVTLREPTGQVSTVAPRGEGQVMARLGGCIVEVSGLHLGRRQWVRKLSVVDAGDGTPAYMGVLRRYGGNWLIDDVNSAATLKVQPPTSLDLAPYDGQRVLLSGVVVGAQTLRVISLRALEEPGQGG